MVFVQPGEGVEDYGGHVEGRLVAAEPPAQRKQEKCD
jgi:hypothetical protein